MNHSNRIGTPELLEVAIMNAITIGPVMGIHEQLFNHIKDFIAQKFCTAMLLADEEQAKLLQDLFDEITRRQS